MGEHIEKIKTIVWQDGVREAKHVAHVLAPLRAQSHNETSTRCHDSMYLIPSAWHDNVHEK